MDSAGGPRAPTRGGAADADTACTRDRLGLERRRRRVAAGEPLNRGAALRGAPAGNSVRASTARRRRPGRRRAEPKSSRRRSAAMVPARDGKVCKNADAQTAAGGPLGRAPGVAAARGRRVRRALEASGAEGSASRREGTPVFFACRAKRSRRRSRPKLRRRGAGDRGASPPGAREAATPRGAGRAVRLYRE